jgi:DNA (cytosine-5)-methyltransferase 1
VTEKPLTGLRFIDLFAGIGGFHVALGPDGLGAECVMASEIDADCRLVYARRWPETRLEGDIRELTRDVARIPEHEILCGGFPCQPFSKSGFQMGLKDRTRGTLFFEIMEIVRARRPKYVFLENVRNIAGPRHRDTWRVIIDSLREEGYEVADEPIVFSPHLLPPERGGTPQVRERIFILARHIGGTGGNVAPLVENRPVDGWDPKRWEIASILQPASEIVEPERYALRPDEFTWLEAWEEFIKLVDEEPLPGFPIWVDAFVAHPRIKGDTPDWKADFLRKNSALYLRHRVEIDDWMERRRIHLFPTSRRKFEWQARGWDHSIWNLLIHLRPSGVRVKPPTYVPALVAITQTSIFGPLRRRLTPREAARLQGFPEDFALHESDKIAYKQLGNAVAVGAIRHAADALVGARTRADRPTQSVLLAS